MNEFYEINARKRMHSWKITAILTVIAWIAGTPSWAGAAIINVPGDAASIAAAITAASAGDTIVVGTGIFTENLVLGKDVTLEGAQSGVDACGRDGTVETIIDASAGVGINLKVGSAGATIDGFTIINATKAIISSSGPIDDVTIQNNRMLTFTSSGIFLNDNGSDITLHRNYIDGTSMGGGGALHLDTDTFAGMQITENCIANGVTGFFVDGNRNVKPSVTRGALIDGNLFDNNTTGANVGKRALDTASVTNNIFKDSEYDGLQGGPKLTTISDNLFVNNGRFGLALTSFGDTNTEKGAQNSEVIDNCFIGNQNSGLFFSSGQAANTISTNVANGNNFSGNTTGAFYGGTEAIDAESNWWGASDGPSGDGTGSGDSVDGAGGGGAIDFDPYEMAKLDLACNTFLPPTYSCEGFEPPMNLALLPGPFGGGEIGRTVKKNRVLPFKATLVDGDGNPITDLIAPPVIDVSFDPTIGPTEDVTDDALTPGKRNEGNQFVLAGDKWTFNLWTKNYFAAGRYTVTMQSGDTGEYTIDPICRGLFVIEP